MVYAPNLQWLLDHFSGSCKAFGCARVCVCCVTVCPLQALTVEQSEGHRSEFVVTG